jgi:hypothetical protein
MPESRNSRQSFLGPRLDNALREARIAVIGLSGGGSHVVQQLAHIGFQHFYLFDPDCIEDTNLARLVGANVDDVAAKRPKVDIAHRVIRAVQPLAHVRAFQSRWQDQAEELRCVDLVFGCVDSFLGRRDLEQLTRRYRIPYLDIGMDVLPEGSGHRMFGQAALSISGGPCFFCQKLLTRELLDREGTQYGSAGIRPQVVWANGVLASSAVGIAMDLLTGWGGQEKPVQFLSFDGNRGTLSPDPRGVYCPSSCSHYDETKSGDPTLVRL